MAISVFLSTVSDEFRAYRDQLVHDLTRHNVAVKVQEDFKALGGDTLDKLDTYIGHCDAVVHLVGDMCGALADETQQQALLAKHSDLAQRLPPLGEALESRVCLPYTQWEAWLALYHGKPLMIAQAAADAPRGPSYMPTEASRAAQAAHLARLKAFDRYPDSEFGSPDQLAKWMAFSAILDLLVEHHPGTSARNDSDGMTLALLRDENENLRIEIARLKGQTYSNIDARSAQLDQKSSGVFLSYRRDDSAGVAGRIYDRLVRRMGRERVFFDVDNLRPGVDFVQNISEKVSGCNTLLAIIGKAWLTAVDELGKRRLDNEKDFVRIEIETALGRGISVIPVLVDGAIMPRRDNLPEALMPLADRQGLEISYTRFDSDAKRLIRAVQGDVGRPRTRARKS